MDAAAAAALNAAGVRVPARSPTPPCRARRSTVRSGVTAQCGQRNRRGGLAGNGRVIARPRQNNDTPSAFDDAALPFPAAAVVSSDRTFSTRNFYPPLRFQLFVSFGTFFDVLFTDARARTRTRIPPDPIQFTRPIMYVCAYRIADVGMCVYTADDNPGVPLKPTSRFTNALRKLKNQLNYIFFFKPTDRRESTTDESSSFPLMTH